MCEPILANFASLWFPGHEAEDAPRLQKLSDWCEQEYRARYADFERRKATGHIRECHGDMHLGNMFLDDGKVTIFDGIEFNETLRWIDVLSEVAFLVMDLEDRGRPDLGRRLLNGYLEQTGDYEGLSVFRYYTTYRAQVRAKVAAIRATQGDRAEAETAQIRREYEGYLTLAEQFATSGRPALFITHGVSGSGKSTGTQPLVEQLGAIRIRSDIERKRLAGIAPAEQSTPTERASLYSAEFGVQTYERLAKLADSLLAAGFAVVADATFLKRTQRDVMRDLAARHQTPFFILDFQADEATLRERIVARQRAGHDPSEADVSVLECQLRSQEPLNEEEVASAVAINPGQPLDWQSLVPQMRRSAESGSS